MKTAEQLAAENAALKSALQDALNTVLWLERRISKGYGEVPHVKRTIASIESSLAACDAPYQVTLGGDGIMAGLKMTIDPTLPPDTIEWQGEPRVRVNLKTGEMTELPSNPLMRRAYTMSEPHLSGYRVIMGFATRKDAQDAHEFIAKQTALQPAAPMPQHDVPPEMKEKADKVIEDFINGRQPKDKP